MLVRKLAGDRRRLHALSGLSRSGGSVWLLRGIPLADVYDVAAQGLTLPPKSTYFYPKVPSGLAIHPLA